MIERYSLPEMAAVWSDANKFMKMLKVEVAHLHASSKLGLIPDDVYKQVNSVSIDVEEIRRIEKTTHHDVAAFVSHVEDQIGGNSVYLHRGLTGSDIVDTALALQLVQSNSLILGKLKLLCYALDNKSQLHAKTWTIGRSHGIHAEPTSFGLVLAGHMMELCRAAELFTNAAENVKFGTLSGPVGTYSNTGYDVELVAMEYLGLQVEPVPTQIVPRDRHAALLMSMVMIAKAVERMATNFRSLQRTEIDEVCEQFHVGQKGSSAMPHKRNPMVSENMCGLSRMISGYCNMITDNVVLWHERDISHSSVERVAIPDAMTALYYMLDRAASLVSNLVVNSDRMLENLKNSMPKVASSHLVTALTQHGMPRNNAYATVQDITLNSRNPLNEVGLREYLTVGEILKCMDHEHFVHNVPKILDRAVYKNRMTWITIDAKMGVTDV